MPVSEAQMLFVHIMGQTIFVSLRYGVCCKEIANDTFCVDTCLHESQ